MKKKPTINRYVCILLLIFLIACGRPPAALPTDISLPTAVSPTLISPTIVPTSTLIPATPIPSPLPPLPTIAFIAPDPIQVARWKEYENALAKSIFPSLPPEEVVCEWEILGRNEQEVYVWTYCASLYSSGPSEGDMPAVVHIGADGSVISVEIPGSRSTYSADLRVLFPPDVQEKYFGRLAHFQERMDRLRWRRGHPDEPPWIVLNTLSIQPTPAIIPWVTPDSMHVEKWREYQTALAEQLSYLPPEQVLCEWELLGRSGNEVYAWAVCGEIWDVRTGLEGLFRIDTAENGSVQNAVSSGTAGIGFPSEIRKMFPPDVQERYFHGLIHFQELVDHLRWRLRHPQEPPLIVLGLTSTP